jgi:acyl-CoA synthetase (NDP forming)
MRQFGTLPIEGLYDNISTMLDLSGFFNPNSIALIGASEKPGKLSGIILQNLLRACYKGNLYPVNPSYNEIFGLKCFPSVTEIPEEVDLAVIAIPAPNVPKVLKECGDKKIGSVIIVSSGFREVGRDGVQLEKEIKDISIKMGIRLIGPNCMGLYDPIACIDTFFIPPDRMGRPEPGPVAILSQSGSFAVTFLDILAYEGMGVSKVVNYGNRLDIGESELLRYLADDEKTKVIALYIESIEDGREFVKASSYCSKRKAVVAFKAGKREAGASAAHSHTGAMAGRYEIYKAAFRKAGVVEAETYGELLDACKILSFQRPAIGKKTLIVTDGGGIGVAIADLCGEHGLEVVDLPVDVKERLKGRLPSFYTLGNPIDLTGSATDDEYGLVLREALSGDGYDLAIVTALWGPPALTDRLIDIIAESAELTGKPLLICSIGGRFTMSKKSLFEVKGLPVFPSPERAVKAASLLIKRGLMNRSKEA